MEFHIAEGPTIIVKHKDESVVFDITAYDRKTIVETPNLFREANSYLAQLPSDYRNDLFKLYVDVKNTLDEIFDASVLTSATRALVTKIYSLIDYYDVLKYTQACVDIGERNPNSSSAILIPPDPQIELSDTDRSELTYLKHQSIELLAYGIYLRYMLPIWGTYMGAVAGQTGNRYKEYYAFSLVRDTQATEVDAFTKLKDYAEFLLEPELNKTIAVYDGVGSDELPDLIIAQAIVRRVSLNVISTNQLSSFIVSYIYNFIKTVPKSLNRILGGPVKDNKSTFKDDNNDSVLDVLRARDAIAPGTIKLQEIGLWDVCLAARQIYPESKDDIVMAFKDAMSGNANFSRESFQFSLTMMFMNTIINGPSLDYIDFDKYYRSAVVVAQSVIYQMGYPTIAALLSAVKIEGDPPLLNGSITRLTKELNMQILSKYSHYQNDVKDEYDKKGNKAIIKEIEDMVDEFVTYIWEPHVPNIPPYNEQSSSIIHIPTDIRVQIANLICEAN